MKRVGIADLKDNLSRYVRAAEVGEVIEVTDRDRVVARIAPAGARPEVTIRPASRPFREIRNRTYVPANWPVDARPPLPEERGQRGP